jgi:glucose/arabinose dehydrogenase
LIERTPYTPGQRTERAGAREHVIGGMVSDGMGGMMPDPLSAQFQRGGRQTHGLAASISGRIYATRGEYSSCSVGPGGAQALGTGEVYSVGMHTLTRVLYGFRNPMYARCHFSRELCMVSELGEDQTTGAIEKLLVIPNTVQWFGYPCCYQRGVGPLASSGACDEVQQEAVSIRLGDTPFGFDWERGRWPEPYRNALFVALHGSYYTGTNFVGAGVVYLRTDPATGIPLRQTPTRFIEATNGQAMPSLRRPTDVVFAPDGRMFVSDDYGGGIYMIAPRFER